MTTNELNRAIWRMADNIETNKLDPYSQEAKDEFNRLYKADITLKSLNAHSLRVLIAMNRIYEYEPYKAFGMHIVV